MEGNSVKSQILFALAVLAAITLGGCATSPPGHGDGTNYRVSPARADLVRVAAAQIGTPYRYGGNSRTGFDCSGLVEYAHRSVGLQVPRTTAGQWRSARAVDTNTLSPGDLVFFSFSGGKSRHVGIYEGDGTFIHAPSSGKHVGRASLDNPFWRRSLVGARSFL
jgi:cell wall-associated NlpC family hydrolase